MIEGGLLRIFKVSTFIMITSKSKGSFVPVESIKTTQYG